MSIVEALNNDHHAFVDGSFVAVEPGPEVIDPATGEIIGHTPATPVAVVEEAIAAADRALAAWRRTTPAERAELLLALAERIDRDAEMLAAIETANVGMPIVFSEAIVAACADALRFFAGAARALDGPATGDYVTGMTSFMRREPVGVVGQLLPWNVPLLMAAWKIGPALAGGNAVVVKPSRRTPLSVLRFCESAADIIPAGLINVVAGRHDVVAKTLAASPIVRMIALTGSAQAGVAVTKSSADTVKRLHLELGGNTAVLVCADADVEAAAAGIVRGGLDNAGQDCTAASRVLVEATVADELVGCMQSILTKVRIGDPGNRSTQMGPLIARDRRESVLRMLEQAKSEGAEIVHGGRELPGPGAFMEPALVLDPEGRSSIVHREIFGPVISVERWNDEDDAVSRVNRSDFGLAAGIWTRSVRSALALSNRLEAGKIWVNEHHRDATEMPHGGIKRSGHGSDLSMLAVEEYTTAKAVHVRYADE